MVANCEKKNSGTVFVQVSRGCGLVVGALISWLLSFAVGRFLSLARVHVPVMHTEADCAVGV